NGRGLTMSKSDSERRGNIGCRKAKSGRPRSHSAVALPAPAAHAAPMRAGTSLRYPRQPSIISAHCSLTRFLAQARARSPYPRTARLRRQRDLPGQIEQRLNLQVDLHRSRRLGRDLLPLRYEVEDEMAFHVEIAERYLGLLGSRIS